MTSAAPGFYGKAPALGDFVARRLPATFLETWDRCLAEIVQSSRARLGGEWLAAWNEAPVWHFCLGAGIAGDDVWFGVLIPSVDRVGRQFPFTILSQATADGLDAAAWSLRVEAFALGALDDDFDPAVLATELERLGPPGIGGTTPLPAGDSVWSCRGSPRVPAALRRFNGLPSAADAARLIA